MNGSCKLSHLGYFHEISADIEKTGVSQWSFTLLMKMLKTSQSSERLSATDSNANVTILHQCLHPSPMVVDSTYNRPDSKCSIFSRGGTFSTCLSAFAGHSRNGMIKN